MLDGSIAIVEQTRQYERVYTGSDMGLVPRKSSITFDLPAVSSRPIVWSEHLHPMVLNIYRGRLYLVGKPFTRREALKYGSPNPPYVAFEFANGTWNRLAFGEIPVEIYRANLRIDNRPPSSLLVTLEMKRAEREDPRYASIDKVVDPHYRLN